MDKWDTRFLNIAKEVATWSKDPSSKIGAIAVKDRVILSTGYNGFPRGIDDSEDRYQDKEQKYKYVVHGEMNCIYNAAHIGINLNNSDMYVYGLPTCSECAKGIIQIGVKRVFSCYPETIGEKWKVSEIATKEMFDEAGVEYFRCIDTTKV